MHECHTQCWCHPVKDPESKNLYAHNAKDCREKWERQGLDMPPLSLWVTVEEKLNDKDQATRQGHAATTQHVE